MADSTTGDIIWRRTDPTTWELSNRPPAEAAPPSEVQQQAEAPADPQVNLTGRDTTELEKKMFEMAQAMGRPKSNEERIAEVNENPALKRMLRRQLRNFHKSIKDDPSNIPQGVQELMDSGAIWFYDHDGQRDIYGALPEHSEARRNAMVDAVRQWDNYVNSGGQLEQRQWQTMRAVPQE